MEQMDQCMPVTGERCVFIRRLRLQVPGELRKFGVGDSGPLVMDAMVWLVEQRPGDYSSAPVLADNAASALRIVEPVRPTCSMYFRQLCRFAAM
jgi:hypothetical protein